MSDWTNLYAVYEDEKCRCLVMVAPEATIRMAFGLRHEAWTRVRNETVNEGTCKLTFNWHPQLNLSRIYVRQLPLVRL